MILGVMTSLLQEIISVYPLLNPSQLTAAASNRVCNALALLQCVASHGETRGLFLSGSCIECLHPQTTDGLHSAHSPFSLPVLEYDIQVSAVRISPPHVPRCHRGSCQE